MFVARTSTMATVVFAAACGFDSQGLGSGHGGEVSGASTGEAETTEAEATTSTTSTSTSTSGDSTTASETGCASTPWYADLDGDGFGDPAMVVQACTAPAGHVDNGDDCNDEQAGINPDRPELCNDVDDDCNGVVDEYSEQNLTCKGCMGHVDGSFVYYACSGNVTWQQARAACQDKATDLVSITSPTEDTLVASLISQHMPGDAWIGLRRDGVGLPFGWIDGTPLDYTNWRPGEPANTSQEVACGELDVYEGGVWNDVDCTDAATAGAWVCKGPIP